MVENSSRGERLERAFLEFKSGDTLLERAKTENESSNDVALDVREILKLLRAGKARFSEVDALKVEQDVEQQITQGDQGVERLQHVRGRLLDALFVGHLKKSKLGSNEDSELVRGELEGVLERKIQGIVDAIARSGSVENCRLLIVRSLRDFMSTTDELNDTLLDMWRLAKLAHLPKEGKERS